MAKWISVKDRLPERTVQKYVACRDTEPILGTDGDKCFVGHFYICDESGYFVFVHDLADWFDGYYGGETNNITHWMPLPSLPKGE